MDRVTDSMLIRKVERMQAAGMDVGLDGQYGRFAVCTKDESRKLSDRTTNSHIWSWLDAFEQGWDAHRKASGITVTRYNDNPFPVWECCCGTTNGVNLVNCRQCGRTTAEGTR